MSTQNMIDRIEAQYPQGLHTPLFDRVSPIAHYRAVSVPDFNLSVQRSAERLMEQGQARAEYEEREAKARFECLIDNLTIGGRDEDRVRDILTDVLASDGCGDMLRLLVRAGLQKNWVQVEGLCQAMVSEGAQLYADSEGA